MGKVYVSWPYFLIVNHFFKMMKKPFIFTLKGSLVLFGQNLVLISDSDFLRKCTLPSKLLSDRYCDDFQVFSLFLI